jgi:hypothetical protein
MTSAANLTRRGKSMPTCPPEALDAFAQSLSAYVNRAGDATELKSAALAVWNCLDPSPSSCADLDAAVGRSRQRRGRRTAPKVMRALILQ